MFLMDSAGFPPTCMISVAIECLSAVAPRVPTLLTFDPLCQAGAPDARTDPPGPERWLLQTWPIRPLCITISFLFVILSLVAGIT
ncbi:hypothetical protein ROHU_005478 [Labeo rohita]|uniref:Uncharacterized protein n=1 Tax=Labeo rohita TaxID=84645 RepID=A0A498ND76_LABRO|nr:hypothetical protein ROHU_005478 [Labeo rohita]